MEVRRLGLSRVGDQSLLTIVLNHAGEGKVTPRDAPGKPQLVVDFPLAQAGRLPAVLAGDEVLVEKIRTESLPGGVGVRIILELYPNKPYTYWRQSRPGSGGQAIFLVGLKPGPGSTREPAAVPEPARPPDLFQKEVKPEPGAEKFFPPEGKGIELKGGYAELGRLIPKAKPLLHFLETGGWHITESQDYDRPGQRLSRGFVLTNRQYPEMAVKIVNLPANTPGSPNINIITLSFDNLTGETVDKYRQLRKLSFAQIKTNFEDIGDFFDEALKPLRVELRKQCQTLAERYAALLQNFLKQVCPQDPKVGDLVMKYVREKVSPRFEGVQHTMSEDPLVILNLVDFLYIRIYYLDSGPGGSHG
ncbi:MAG: hypothetical protein A2Y80_04420 [Deltaproteobacteria bacterium RBG_13_58_19]|nr:MAG: hypothetical protein A2Y80_04420 [Deltaproteobacteria bacterium RBG_13_58_19]